MTVDADFRGPAGQFVAGGRARASALTKGLLAIGSRASGSRDSSKRLLQPGLHLRIAESVNQYSTGHNRNDFGLSAMSPNSPILLHFLPKPVSVNTEQG